MNVAPDCLPVGSGSHPRAGLTGWCLSLSLHGIVILALAWLAPLAAPAGGGGGAGVGSGAGTLCVDLAGLGTGCPVQDQPPALGAAAARTDDAMAPPRPQPSRHTVPVLKAPPRPAPRTDTHRQSRRDAPSPRTRTASTTSAAKVEAPGDTSGAAPFGGSGPGRVAPGGASGTGGGTGDGQGAGRGPAVGAGQGSGEPDGMRLADVDVKPRITRQVEPAYPEEARRQGVEGRVVARLLVTARGSVARLHIVAAKPSGIFEQAVLDAVGKWRFHPARYQGRDVAAWVMLPIRFDLKH